MIRLAVVSGKGGTGKTVVTAGFAALAGGPMLLADCDVEAANLELLLSARWARASPFEGAETAVVDPEKCWGCGRCVELCRFGALTVRDDALAVCEPRDCEGCGLCERVCPNGAITLKPRVSGAVLRSTADYGSLSHARLYPGSGNSGLLVQTVKHQTERHAGRADLLLIDSPPGTGCPLISTVGGTDAVVVVAEPSRSGLHDLRRVVGVCRRFGVRIFAVINRWDLDPAIAGEIEAECTARGIPVLGRIPFDPAVIEAVRAGRPISGTDSPAAGALADCWAVLGRELGLARAEDGDRPSPEQSPNSDDSETITQNI
ncbi:MAG: ATP-binding protein [Methanospirillum sp.]